MIPLKELGARIKAARIERRLTQKELASAVGLTGSQICKLERGKSGTPWGRMGAIAQALGVEPDWLEADAPAGGSMDPTLRDLLDEIGREGQRRLVQRRRLLLALAEVESPRLADQRGSLERAA